MQTWRYCVLSIIHDQVMFNNGWNEESRKYKAIPSQLFIGNFVKHCIHVCFKGCYAREEFLFILARRYLGILDSIK